MASDRQPYIVAVTASALPEDRERFIAAGINEYLAKPVIVNDLAAKLKKAYSSTRKWKPGQDHSPAGTESPYAVVQLDELRTRLGKTANELLRRVIPVFVREMPGRQRTLREAHSNQDSVTFARLCHSLKGSCRSIGADPLAKECERLEQISYGGELPSANEFEAFVTLSDDTVQALSDELKLLEKLYQPLTSESPSSHYPRFSLLRFFRFLCYFLGPARSAWCLETHKTRNIDN